MTDQSLKNKVSLWKRFEKFTIVIGLLSGIVAIFTFYYQMQAKSNKIEFQLISKDYLTANNNIDGLKSNYIYAGIPVKNLWLIKFKLINSGDGTLVGIGQNSSILDSSIIFKLANNVQILNKINLLQNNFPDHKITRIDSNTLSLTFQQWRKEESATYSIYVKSSSNNISLLPSAKRLIKDGDISIIDLANRQDKGTGPLIDKFIPSPWNLIGRILGVTLSILVLSLISYLALPNGYYNWYKILIWKNTNYSRLKELINSPDFLENDANFDSNFNKSSFVKEKEKYANDPLEISPNAKFWRNVNLVKPDISLISSWKSFFWFTLILLVLYYSCIATVLGLISY